MCVCVYVVCGVLGQLVPALGVGSHPCIPYPALYLPARPLPLAPSADTTGSYQYSPLQQRCIKCPAGLWRDYADSTTNECKEW